MAKKEESFQFRVARETRVEATRIEELSELQTVSDTELKLCSRRENPMIF